MMDHTTPEETDMPSKPRKPRVTAAGGVRGNIASQTSDGNTHVTPSVEVVVEFDHGSTIEAPSADEALAALDKVVADVTAQIEETRT